MTQIILQDLYHLYKTLLEPWKIESILWIGSVDCPFFTILSQCSSTMIVTASQYTMGMKISYMYIEKKENLAESIAYFKPIVFTPVYSDYSGYVSLPVTPSLYCMMPGNLTIEYLPTLGRDYNFNASVVGTANGPLYSIRSSDSKFTHSDLEFIGPSRKTIEYSGICREDVRLFTWKNELYGSYTYIKPYVAGIRTYNVLMVGRFNTKLEIVEEIVPPYGGNLNNSPEKNWTWWESPSGKLQCVYMFTPLKILEFTDLYEAPKDITVPYSLPDTIRGGACGVVYDGKVWCFTHTSMKEGGFNVGVVVLSHTDIPEVLGYCNTIVASKDYKNIFFYICGAYFDSLSISWKLTGGVQDSKACVLTIPHSDVLAKLRL